MGDTIRRMPVTLDIVPVEQIPKETVPCPVDDLQKLYKTCILMENVCLNNDGIGLSAVQVGIPWKLFIVRYKMPDPKRRIDQIYFQYFLDCHYEPQGEEKDKSIEGCLSLRHPDGRLRHFEVDRYKRVKVVGKELRDRPHLHVADVILQPDDIYRVVFQHEIDHQNNVLISDIGKELNIWK